MTVSAEMTKFAPTTTTTSCSSRRGKGRSEMREVYLYVDKTIKVDRDSAEVLPRGVPPPSIGGVGFGPSPNLATDRTICELCLPFERGMGMSMNLADPVSSGKYSGTCVSTAPVDELTAMSFTVPLTGDTIVEQSHAEVLSGRQEPRTEATMSAKRSGRGGGVRMCTHKHPCLQPARCLSMNLHMVTLRWLKVRDTENRCQKS